MSLRIAMIGAGSFFTDSMTEGLCRSSELFAGSTFTLMDTDPKRLRASERRNKLMVKEKGADITIKATTDRRRALDGCDYVVTSFDRDRAATWLKDLEIPMRYGVHQYMGENGGPGGQAHAMRNITVFMDICRDMHELCPNAWVMNFTNPMSFVCTYLNRYGGVPALGFCHQVHGSFGVVAEMLGMEPGELQVITAGVNHFNWLIDIRKRGAGESCREEFFERVRKSTYWKKNRPRHPAQQFTRDVLENFGLYVVGYDDHVSEYVPFFYPREEWEKRGYEPHVDALRRSVKSRRKRAAMSDDELLDAEVGARAEYRFAFPFPKDGGHPHYQEKPTEVMEALAANKLHYLTAIVIPNCGAVDNLPHDAVVDAPGVAIGGEVRGVHVGPLPTFAAELCRRQIAIHELLVDATVQGDRQKVMQSMALDPYVHTIKQARQITDAFLKYYREDLPQFQ